MVEGNHAIGLAQRHAQREGYEADCVVVEVTEGRLHGVQRFNQRVAGETVFAHGSVHDLPSFIVARQRRGYESEHESSRMMA